MTGVIWFVVIIAAWIVVNRFILPKLGVDT